MWLTAEPSVQQGEASIPHRGVHRSVEGWGVLEGAGASSDHHLTQGKKAPKMDLFFLSLCPPRPGSKATAGSLGFSAVLRRQSLHSSFYFQTPLSFPGTPVHLHTPVVLVLAAPGQAMEVVSRQQQKQHQLIIEAVIEVDHLKHPDSPKGQCCHLHHVCARMWRPETNSARGPQ